VYSKPAVLYYNSCVKYNSPQVSILRVHIQGGAVNRGLKRFFSIYRPSCLIKAYIRPEKYCFVWAGPLANHPFNFNFIFLSDGATAAA
jgi:hypothetical protein